MPHPLNPFFADRSRGDRPDVCRVLVALLAMICMAGGNVDAQLPVIGLRALSQSFFAPGASYEVTIAEGANTEEVREFVFSHPGITATLLSGPARPLTKIEAPRYGSFSVTVAPDVPEGRYEVRAVGRFGISNPRSIVVQKEIRIVPSVGTDPSTATVLQLGHAHCRRVSPQRRDFYSFDAIAGKQYSIRVIAQAIDSRLIGAVSVADAKGQTLDSAIGSDHSDLHLTLTATDNGPLTVAVHDALFRGGAAYPYGLLVTEGIHRQPDLRPEFPKSISVVTRDPVEVDETDVPIELAVPACVEADFDSVSDTDQYLCKLSEGKPVLIEVVSDRIGQPTDARLIIDRSLVDAAGTQTWQRVATAEDGPNLSDSVIRLATGDPVLRFQPPEDGDYRITVADLDTGQSLGQRQRYQLAIGPPHQDWQLLAYHVYPHKDPKTSQPSGTHLMRGAATAIRVFVVRNQMSAPIRVSIPQLPPGLVCRPAWIAANQNHTDLLITATDQATTQHSPLQVVGEVTRDGQSETRQARAASVIWQQDGYRPIAHTRLTDPLKVASSDLDTCPLSIDPASQDVVVAKKGTKVTVPIKVTRREGGSEAVVLRAQHLPPGVSAGDLTIAKDKSEAEWTIDVRNNAAVGSYSFWGQGETKVKFAVNPQALTRETQYRDTLKTIRADPDRSGDHAEIDKAIAETEKRIEAIKKQVAARDFTVYVPMSLITLEIQ